MAPAVTTFLARRWAMSLGTLGLGLGLTGAWWLGWAALRPVGLYTGWLLLGLLLVLTLFNARKRLPFLPLFSASAWLQFHIYAGWLAVLVFFLHAGLRFPGALLGQLLWWGFLAVAASGVFGLWLGRWLPPRLTRSGESLIYERLPRLRHDLQQEASALVRQADTETGSTTLADFHRHLLGPYLMHVPPLLAPLRGDDPAHHRVRLELASLRRYFNEREMLLAVQLERILEAKRNLDCQLAGQRLLKLWLFVHVPLSYGLLVVVGAHVWLVVHYAHRL